MSPGAAPVRAVLGSQPGAHLSQRERLDGLRGVRGTGHTVGHTAGAPGTCVRLTMGSLEEEQCREKGRDLGGLERNKGGKTQ